MANQQSITIQNLEAAFAGMMNGFWIAPQKASVRQRLMAELGGTLLDAA